MENKTRTLQEIFNAVIDTGYYSDKTDTGFMCWALDKAMYSGDINKEECHKALKAISSYIGRKGTLKHYLYELNRPNSFSDRLAIYKNWKNRPRTRLKQ